VPDLRVLDLSDGAGPAYGTKLLADYGATVVKVERPGSGDTARQMAPFKDGRPGQDSSLPFLYLNTNKQSIILDLDQDDGRARLIDLAGAFDVVVESARPGALDRLGVGYTDLSRRNPGLIWIAVTPFGQTGPYRDFRADNLVLSAMGGWMYQLGEPEREPLKPGGALAGACVSGLYVAIAAVALALRRQRDGRGAFVDISEFESYLSATRYFETTYAIRGLLIKRMGNGTRAGYRIVRCKDGYGFLGAFNNAQWELMIDLMELRPLLEERGFNYTAAMGGSEDATGWLNGHVDAWCARHTAAEAFELCQQWRIPFGKVNTPAEVVAMEQLAVREFFATAEHPVAGPITYPGRPFAADRLPWWAGRAPLLGEHNGQVRAAHSALPAAGAAIPDREPGTGDQELPLDGLRVLDLSAIWAGPMAAMVLADLGADVIKVESVQRPEYWRTLLADFTAERWWETSPLLQVMQRNRRDITLNLADPEGRALLEELVKSADVLVENFSPRVMPQFGLGYPRLRELNPRLIMLSSSGFGDTGPLRDYLSTASVGDALSGLSHITGYADGPPAYFGGQNGDPITGLHGAYAVLLALEHRERTGEGQRISAAQLETNIAVIGDAILISTVNGEVQRRAGNADPVRTPHGCYPAAGDDQWIAVSAGSDAEWAALCAAMGRPELAAEPRFRDAASRKRHEADLNAMVAAWTRTLPPEETFRCLQARGVAAGPVMGPLECLADPHLRARGFFATVRTSESGDQPVPIIPIRLDGRTLPIRRRAPRLGEHNAEVLQGELGIDDAAYARLRERQVIGDRPLGS
jgi:crotonobetainyl-CoA:carnitine CoA-transferase CaiB-like acyl-CoA transferase